MKVSKVKDRNDQLIEDSGNIEYSDNLTSVFYQLLRDYIPAGQLEKVVREVAAEPEVRTYSNGFLAQYANNLANYVASINKNRLKKALDTAFEEKTEEQLIGEVEKINQAIKDMGDDAFDEFDYTEKPQTKLSRIMSDLDELKDLVPSDSVEEIVKILKSEIKEDMTNEAKEEIQTRESILEARAKENAEHISGSEEEKQQAGEYIHELTEEDIIIDEPEVSLSRGNLAEVKKGEAFPEALDKVFEENGWTE